METTTPERTNITPTGYTYGGKDYVTEQRFDANNTPYNVDILKGSPTVISNQTKKDQVTDMTTKVSQLSQGRGMTSDGTNTRYADGTLAQDNYQEPTLGQNQTPIYGRVGGQDNRVIGYNQADLKGGQVPTYFDSNSSTPAITPEEQQFNDTLDSMKATTDATTARTISSIQQKYATLRAQQKQINEGQASKVQNALLTGGVTGQGSSSQYAPISSEAIMTAQLSYGVQKLAELDSQEQDLINEAQQAGDTKNYQLMEKKLAMYEKKREEKASEAKKLNEKLIKETTKARETQIQATRDNALADLYSQGITDPKELLSALNGNGGDFTLKEINDSLKNLVPSGLDDLVKTLRNNGAPQDVIQKVLSSGNMNEAYKNAGNFAAGGTGIIGEYNFYRAQAEATGKIPIDFNTYQDMDANRKKAIAKATAGGSTIIVGSDGKVKKVDLKPLNENQARDFTYAQRASQANPTIENITNDVVNMGSFEYKGQSVLEKTGLAGSRVDNVIKQIRQAERNFLTAVLRRESGAQISDSELATGEKLYFPVPGDDATTLAQKKSARDTAIKTIAANVPQYKDRVESIDLEDTNTVLLKSEKEASEALNKIYPSLPQDVKSSLKTLYEAEYSDAQVYEYLRTKGYF